MALGVLNNLSAIYAENNLNKTSNSLQTVLEQLSSGSKINSGADDAAGLSLVNGLEANSQALTQSVTNSTEGVGLLDVADGALSQVTSLLDRAITLATEASNGTLNSSQEAAANQEYTSILAEINNIGSTTTYNQQQVFTSGTVAIYTGDSSAAGSSIDDLNIHTLSETSVGDSNGKMVYNNGGSNVFLDLSKGGQTAAVTDSLGLASATTSIQVSYLTKGAAGAAVQATANVTVGAGTTYANTAQGLINAINNSGLGLTASFGTAAEAGTAAVAAAQAADATNDALSTGATDTGIIISGVNVGIETTNGNGAGQVGALTVNQASDTLGGTLSIASTNGESHNITLGTANSTDTLANLASTINAANYGVTATLNTSTLNGQAAGTVLTFTANGSGVTVSGTGMTDEQTVSAITPGGSSGVADSNGYVVNTFTVNSSTDTLSGVLQVTAGSSTSAPAATDLNLSGMTLSELYDYINANNTANVGQFSDMTATLNSAGTTLSITENTAGLLATGQDPAVSVATGSQILDSSATTGTAVVQQSSLAASTANVTVTGAGTGAGSTLATLSVTNANDNLTGALTVTPDNVAATAGQISMSTVAAWAGTDNVTTSVLANYVNAHNGTNGAFANITATLQNNGTTIKFTETGATTNVAPAITNTASATPTVNLLGLGTGAGDGTASSQMASFTVADANDTLSGALTVTPDNGVAGQFNMSSIGSNVTTTELANYVNSHNGVGGAFDNITATLTNSGKTITFTETSASGSPTLPSITNGVSAITDNMAVNDNTSFGALNVTNAGDSLTAGSISVTGTNGAAQSFTLGIAGTSDNLTDLAKTINSAMSGDGITAQVSQNGTQLYLTTSSANTSTNTPLLTGTGVTTSLALSDTPLADAASTTTLGTLSLPTGGSSADALSGTLRFGTESITLGTAPTTTSDGTKTMAQLVETINSGAYGVTATLNSTGTAITFSSPDAAMASNLAIIPPATGAAGDPADSGNYLTWSTANNGVTASQYYNVGIGGTITDTSTGGGTSTVGASCDNNGTSGTATISYTDASGVSLATTDLINQSDAQAALTSINQAITDVAAMDGYIGAQINTLDSVSSVLNTQMENVTSAQNALQATDYASATSAMSKYEVLSQTGIAALAQANTVQQEVTKLLQ